MIYHLKIIVWEPHHIGVLFRKLPPGETLPNMTCAVVNTLRYHHRANELAHKMKPSLTASPFSCGCLCSRHVLFTFRLCWISNILLSQNTPLERSHLPYHMENPNPTFWSNLNVGWHILDKWHISLYYNMEITILSLLFLLIKRNLFYFPIDFHRCFACRSIISKCNKKLANNLDLL